MTYCRSSRTLVLARPWSGPGDPATRSCRTTTRGIGKLRRFRRPMISGRERASLVLTFRSGCWRSVTRLPFFIVEAAPPVLALHEVRVGKGGAGGFACQMPEHVRMPETMWKRQELVGQVGNLRPIGNRPAAALASAQAGRSPIGRGFQPAPQAQPNSSTS